MCDNTKPSQVSADSYFGESDELELDGSILDEVSESDEDIDE